MKRTLSLILLFARPLHVLNIFFTLLGLWCAFRTGLPGIPISILIKLAGYIGSAAYQSFMDAPAYNYFRNAGFRVRGLYLRVFGFDLSVYLLLLTLLFCAVHVKGR